MLYNNIIVCIRKGLKKMGISLTHSKTKPIKGIGSRNYAAKDLRYKGIVSKCKRNFRITIE